MKKNKPSKPFEERLREVKVKYKDDIGMGYNAGIDAALSIWKHYKEDIAEHEEKLMLKSYKQGRDDIHRDMQNRKPMCIHTNCREEATKNFCANHFGQIQGNWIKLVQDKTEIDEEKLAEWLYLNTELVAGTPPDEWQRIQTRKADILTIRRYRQFAVEAIEYAKRK